MVVGGSFALISCSSFFPMHPHTPCEVTCSFPPGCQAALLWCSLWGFTSSEGLHTEVSDNAVLYVEKRFNESHTLFFFFFLSGVWNPVEVCSQKLGELGATLTCGADKEMWARHFCCSKSFPKLLWMKGFCCWYFGISQSCHAVYNLIPTSLYAFPRSELWTEVCLCWSKWQTSHCFSQSQVRRILIHRAKLPILG